MSQLIRFDTPQSASAAWHFAFGAAQKLSLGSQTWDVDGDKTMRRVRERMEAAGFEFLPDGRDCLTCPTKYLIRRKSP